MAGSDRGKADAAGPVKIDHATSGEVALERAFRFLFDLSPCGVRDRGKLAVKIIHDPSPPLENQFQANLQTPQPLTASARPWIPRSAAQLRGRCRSVYRGA